MTVREAATVIGCSPQHVRTLIRAGKLKAVAYDTPRGYYYDVSPREARRYRDKPQSKGWPRGQSR